MGSPERIQRVAQRIARQKQAGWSRLAVVVSAMAGETNRLVELVKKVNPAADARHYDMVVSAGEQVSVGLMAAALQREGAAAEPLLSYQLGIFTDRDHSRARIQSINTGKLNQIWEQGKIPVIAGFQGITPELNLTTLGRGGGDTSAVAIAVALNAAFCEINTDVNGVYTCDPRIVPNAKLIELLDYDSALELSLLGSKVLHVRSVELAAKYQMPLVVRNTFDTDDSRRTHMRTFSEAEKMESPIVSGVTLERNIAKLTVRGLSTERSGIAQLFDKIASDGINVDIIVHDRLETNGRYQIGFTISENDLQRTLNTMETLKRTEPEISIETRTGLSKVSVVGLGMQTNAGVASRIFNALEKNRIEIHMISTSEIKVSCVITSSEVDQATRAIHAEFFEN